MAYHSQRRSYAVYPSNFRQRGVLWTYKVVSRARSKAKSLGIGTWIRRYVDTVDKNTGKSHWQIERLWRWNGVRFVRLREEPEMYRLPSAKSFHEKAGECQDGFSFSSL